MDRNTLPCDRVGAGAVPKMTRVAEGDGEEESSDEPLDSAVTGISVDAAFSKKENCVSAHEGPKCTNLGSC